MTNFRNAMMAAAHTASGVPLVSVANSALYTTTSQELERTPGSAGNVDKFTFSAWCYFTQPTTASSTPIFGAINTSANQHRILKTNTGQLQHDLYLSNSFVGRLITTQLLRDQAWYHIVAVYDSGNAIAGDRMMLYLNGERITDFATDTNPSQNLDGLICGAHLHQLGFHDGLSLSLNGYMAETVLLDGTVADPNSFGQYDSTGTFWTPKSSAEIKALTFGTTGFYLDNTTNAQTDASGEGNNFTNTGSVVTDTHTPTNIEFLMSPINTTDPSNIPVLTDGNRTWSASSASAQTRIGGNIPFPSSGKWIAGVIINDLDNGKAFGIWSDRTDGDGFPNFGGFSGWHRTTVLVAYESDGTSVLTGANWPQGTTQALGDQCWIAVDIDNSKTFFGYYDLSADAILWYANDAGNDGNPATGDNPFEENFNCAGMVWAGAAQNSKSFTLVKPEDCPFTIPTGYSFLNTTNIAANITRTKSNLEEYFDSTLYEGTGSEQNVVSDTTTNTSAFSWIKNRDAADNHMLFDRVRGATKDIHSNTTDIEVTNAQTVKAFIGGGVTLGTDAEVNTSSESYVLWNWMMETAGSGSSNTDGTINTTSTLVDTNLGLSISTYTGTGANATIGHGLGVVPEFFMVKILDTGGTDWMVYHSALGATKNLVLNKTTSFSTSITRWNNTEPTSSLISLGTTTAVNGSGSTYVCYAFAPSQFISIGSYNGNGNANGTFIPTVNSLGIPIQPAWFMARSTGSGQDWRIVDNKRNPSNVNNLHLRANTTAADTSETNLDIDTGGIKIRTSSGGWNTSGTEYIYLAFGTPIIDVDGRIIGGR